MRPVQMGKPESVPLWKEVELPHCYNAYDVVDPEIPYSSFASDNQPTCLAV